MVWILGLDMKALPLGGSCLLHNSKQRIDSLLSWRTILVRIFTEMLRNQLAMELRWMLRSTLIKSFAKVVYLSLLIDLMMGEQKKPFQAYLQALQTWDGPTRTMVGKYWLMGVLWGESICR